MITPVSVTDRSGHPIDGLSERDFVLLDNGEPRKMDGDIIIEPIALVIAVQTSSSSAAALTKVRAVGSMIEPLITGQRGTAAVLTFDNQLKLVQPFTGDADLLPKAFRSLRPAGSGGRMLDAVEESVRLLREGPAHHRRVLLLIGEAKDRSSEAAVESVLTEAQRENISIYAVTYSTFLSAFSVKAHEVPPPGGMDLLALFSQLRIHAKENAAESLTRYTGGRRYFFLKQKALEQAVSAIGEELHSQYLLSFAPAPESRTAYRSIAVKVPSRPDAVVRSRPGYWLGQN
ncbi:MAG: VWA domain-containing protein [Acidobacteriia bacterium]|nr:VWA domain-containing protein [Terriglobia bacterium]